MCGWGRKFGLGYYECDMIHESNRGEFLVCSKSSGSVGYLQIGNSLQMGTILFILAPSSFFLVHMKHPNGVNGMSAQKLRIENHPH